MFNGEHFLYYKHNDRLIVEVINNQIVPHYFVLLAIIMLHVSQILSENDTEIDVYNNT